MSRVLWLLANALSAIGAAALAMLAVPVLIAAGVRKAWRWLELKAVYGGDEAKRDRDEWRGR